jgi:glycosyltransferase involved in cell wall biosynthesis
MRIIFNVMGVGLGNNGGSHTLIKSANALKELGHDVCFLDTGSSKYTWGKINVPHIKTNYIENCCKNADFIIATGYKSVAITKKAPLECGKKLHWIRGWETWVYPEDRIVSGVLKNSLIKIVNSLCLQDKLKQYGFDSYIVRPGNDFDNYKPLNLRKENEIAIGGLYNQKHFTSKRVDWILQSFSYFKSKYKNIKCYLLGNDEKPKYKDIDYYWRRPTEKEKNIFYNSIDIWLSPTNLEGLHICPQEAMLTEACIVGTSAPMSGMQDYLIHKETGLVAEETIGSFIKTIDDLIQEKDKRIKLGKNGRNKILELGDRLENMKGMINILENI